MLLFFVHEPQAYKGRRAEEPNRNCARYASRFSSSAATVPSTIISESRFLSPAEPTFYTRGFNSLVASPAALIATGWSEPVPGRVYPCCGPAPSRRTRERCLPAVGSPLHVLPCGV